MRPFTENMVYLQERESAPWNQRQLRGTLSTTNGGKYVGKKAPPRLVASAALQVQTPKASSDKPRDLQAGVDLET